MITRTITIAIDVEVHALEDRSGLTDEQLTQRVYEEVAEERRALAMEVRVAALKLMWGEFG